MYSDRLDPKFETTQFYVSKTTSLVSDRAPDVIFENETKKTFRDRDQEHQVSVSGVPSQNVNR